MIRRDVVENNKFRVKFINDFNTYDLLHTDIEQLDYKFIDEISYLTFEIDFPGIGFYYNTMMGGTGMPDNTLLNVSDITSQQQPYPNTALAYLKARGFTNQYEMLSKFITKLNYITYKKPWFFQKLSGLKSVWQAGNNANKTYKGKDLKITIETLESLDLSIAHLADLYRKSIYDTIYMRELVPQNLRYFPVEIYVGEFRNIHNPLLMMGSNYLNGVTNNPISSNLFTGLNSMYNFFNEAIYYKFSCYMCEFDFNESTAFEDTISSGGTIDQSKNRFDIKIGQVLEQHRFGINDAITIDDFAKYSDYINMQNAAKTAFSNELKNVKLSPVSDQPYDLNI